MNVPAKKAKFDNRAKNTVKTTVSNGNGKQTRSKSKSPCVNKERLGSKVKRKIIFKNDEWNPIDQDLNNNATRIGQIKDRKIGNVVDLVSKET